MAATMPWRISSPSPRSNDTCGQAPWLTTSCTVSGNCDSSACRCASQPITGRPSRQFRRPLTGGINPASVFNSVDFPQPFRPTIAVILPVAIVPLSDGAIASPS